MEIRSAESKRLLRIFTSAKMPVAIRLRVCHPVMSQQILILSPVAVAFLQRLEILIGLLLPDSANKSSKKGRLGLFIIIV